MNLKLKDENNVQAEAPKKMPYNLILDVHTRQFLTKTGRRLLTYLRNRSCNRT